MLSMQSGQFNTTTTTTPLGGPISPSPPCVAHVNRPWGAGHWVGPASGTSDTICRSQVPGRETKQRGMKPRQGMGRVSPNIWVEQTQKTPLDSPVAAFQSRRPVQAART